MNTKVVQSLSKLSQHLISLPLDKQNTLDKQQIKTQLSQFNQFLVQQFIRLSAHYETKLEYQSARYQQEISQMKQQIERQYKVIGLMKMELEDLVVLVNERQRDRDYRNSQDRQRRQQIEGNNINQIHQEDKQSRIRKAPDYSNYQGNKSNQGQNNQCETQNQRTVFGLQIITEQQTERTLVSQGQEEGQLEQNLQYQDQYIQDRQLQQHQCIQTNSKHSQQRNIIQGSNNWFMRIEEDQLNESKSQSTQRQYSRNHQQSQKYEEGLQQNSQSQLPLQIVNKVSHLPSQSQLFENTSINMQNKKSHLIKYNQSYMNSLNQSPKNQTQKQSDQSQIYNSSTQHHQRKGIFYFDEDQPSSTYQDKLFKQQKQQKQYNSQYSLSQNDSNQSYFNDQSSLKSQTDQQISQQIFDKVQKQYDVRNSKNSNKNKNFQQENNLIDYLLQNHSNFNNQRQAKSKKNNYVENPFVKKSSTYHELQALNPNNIQIKNKKHTQIQWQQNNQLVRKKSSNQKQNTLKQLNSKHKNSEISEKQLKSQQFLEEFKRSFTQNYSNQTKAFLNLYNNQNTESEHNSKSQRKKSQNIQNKGNKTDQSNNNAYLQLLGQEPLNCMSKSSSVSNKNVISILELIALQPNTKQLNSNKVIQQSNKSQSYRSVSKSKQKKQTKNKPVQNKSNIHTNRTNNNRNQKDYNPMRKNQIPKKKYHQTEQRQPTQEEQQAITMIRMTTQQNLQPNNHSNRYFEEYHQDRQLKSHQNTQFFSNKQDSYRNTAKNYSQSSQFYVNSDQRQIQSLQTTFGKPSSSQFLKDISSAINNKENLQYLITASRKGSVKVGSKEMHKQKSSNNNRKMSHNLSSSNQNIKPKRDLNKLPIQDSIQSMLLSHFESSNKFLVGQRKQQLKYDGERVNLHSFQNSQSQTMRHGHGMLYYSNGLIYQGDFYHNKRQGFGILRFNHVELYAGEWHQDQLNGQGKIRNCAIINKRKNNPNHDGKQNSMIGSTKRQNISNIQLFNKWISYCGTFKNNRFEGQGTLYLQGGQKFAGIFRNGTAYGEGSLFKKNGQIQNGIWKNNVLIQKLQAQWNN